MNIGAGMSYETSWHWVLLIVVMEKHKKRIYRNKDCAITHGNSYEPLSELFNWRTF